MATSSVPRQDITTSQQCLVRSNRQPSFRGQRSKRISRKYLKLLDERTRSPEVFLVWLSFCGKKPSTTFKLDLNHRLQVKETIYRLKAEGKYLESMAKYLEGRVAELKEGKRARLNCAQVYLLWEVRYRLMHVEYQLARLQPHLHPGKVSGVFL